MRASLTCMLLLAAISIPASAQITVTPIIRERTTPLLRMAFLSAPSPAMGRRGQQNLTVQLNGVGTHFTAGTTSVTMGDGVTVVAPVTVVSPTSATAVISIDPSAAPGLRTVSVTTGSEIVTLADGFSVTELPDQFGKVCYTASTLGFLSPGSSRAVTGIIDMPAVEDWFSVTIPSSAMLKATMSASDASVEFEESAQTACGSTPIATTTPGVLPKEMTLIGTQSQTFLIRVRASRWSAASSRFTLTLLAQ